MTYYEINAQALRHNILYLGQLTQVPIWAVLKYDGYGVGLLTLAHTLHSYGISRFAVCHMREAMALRSAGFTEDILLLSPQTDDKALRDGLENSVIFSVGDWAYANHLAQMAKQQGKEARVHIALDTGMGRFGFLPDEYEQIRSLYRQDVLKVEGIYSHFSSAWSDDSTTRRELQRFQQVLQQLRQEGIDCGTAHMANSSAFFRCRSARLDAVRLGSAIVGRIGGVSAEESGLQNVGTLVTDVCAVRTLQRGERVGYDGELRLRRDTTLAVLSAGYWHGMPQLTVRGRLLRRYPTVTIGGRQAPIVSTSSASHAIVDVTGLHVTVGAEARIAVNPLHLNPTLEKRVV